MIHYNIIPSVEEDHIVIQFSFTNANTWIYLQGLHIQIKERRSFEKQKNLPMKCLYYKHCTFQKSSNWEHPWTAAPIFLFFCFCGKTLAHYSSLLNALWWVWKVPFPIVQEYSIASPFFIISRFLFQKHTPFFIKFWSNNDYILRIF